MSATLLQTKLYIPPPRPNLVPRTRLIKQLNEGLKYKMTLVSAPAGFGKTTLMTSWIDQLEYELRQSAEQSISNHPRGIFNLSRVAWLSLDERDNSPSQFWHYVIAALQTIDTSLGEAGSAILESQQTPPLESLVTLLINDLAEFQPEAEHLLPLLLVLDDYHSISTEAIHESLNFFIDHIPPSLHLIITTRSDPPLHLAQRQARSETTQIRAADLSFTEDEVAEFLNRIMGLNLSGSEISALESCTEGWIAGLQLAALSLQDQKDKHTIVSDIAGDDRYIADYLVDQVLNRQQPHIQTFLLQTSILGQISASLCNAITSQNDSQSILSELDRNNLFLTPLDNRREWYRYHQLFADLLRQRLSEIFESEEIANLHRKATHWYEQRGNVIEAVDHAIYGEDYHTAARIIEQQITEIFSQFKLNTLSKWIQMFPEQTLAAQPKLIMIYAWTLLATGKYKEAEECLQTIENNLNIKAEEAAVAGLANLDPELRGALIEVMVVRSVISISQFNIQQTLDLCQVVLPYLDDNLHPHLFNEPLSMRTVVVFNMGLAYEFSGEVGKAADALREAVSLSLEQENFNILPMAMAHLGQLQILQGHLYHAQKTYRQGLDMSTGETGIASPVAGIAEIGMGNLMYEWNDLDLARNHFTAGINLAKRWNHAESLLAGYTGLVRIKQAQGDLASAVKLLEELADMLKDLGAHIFLPIVDTSFARIWISQGDLSAANRWLQSSGIGVDSSLSFLQEYDYLTLIRLLIAQRRWDEASRLIRRLLAFSETGKRYGRVIELQSLHAIALYGQGKSDQVLPTLSKALTIAEPEGYVRTFIDEGPQMGSILCQAAANDTNPVYVNKLLRAFNAEQPIDEKAIKTEIASENSMVEPLSEREIEVLQCIAEGLSNRDIAQRLMISLSTVKSHTRSIYGKLEVNSRTQAVARAKSWGILPSS